MCTCVRVCAYFKIVMSSLYVYDQRIVWYILAWGIYMVLVVIVMSVVVMISYLYGE